MEVEMPILNISFMHISDKSDLTVSTQSTVFANPRYCFDRIRFGDSQIYLPTAIKTIRKFKIKLKINEITAGLKGHEKVHLRPYFVLQDIALLSRLYLRDSLVDNDNSKM